MRERLMVKYTKEGYVYHLGNRKLSSKEVLALEYLEDNEGYWYKISEVSITGRLCVEAPFGSVTIAPNHYFYYEVKELTLESVAERWRAYFMEDDDSVNMTMKEHKQFAEECAEAGITALDVYNYLGI